MNSSARHARKKNPLRSRLLRAGLTVTAAGAVVTGAGGAASAAEQPLSAAAEKAKSDRSGLRTASEGLTRGVHGSLGGAVGAVKHLQLNPLAKTGVDPLDNVLSTQIADFRPVSTAAVTGPLAEGASLAELPVVGKAVGLLPG